MNTPVGVGLAGVGAFGEFCLSAFSDTPEVSIAAVADSDLARSERFAAQYGAAAYGSLDAMLGDPSVEVVALNTPPYLHEAQGLAVLSAGRHLFCEKPLALSVAGAETMLGAARKHNVRITVDYVMRRNPLWAAAAELRQSGLLGKLLHMSLINHAAGLNLPDSHWFWDKSLSGGIWIEHGVHFFDAFAWVAGQSGQIVGARQFARPDGKIDRVEALARYGNTPAHFYHGFTHDSVTEQTTVTLAFEHGYIALREWVPTELELLTSADARSVVALLPGEVSITARGVMTGLVSSIGPKASAYRAAIQAGIREFAHAVRDSSHNLLVTGAHGLDSLRMAVDAEQFSSTR